MMKNDKPFMSAQAESEVTGWHFPQIFLLLFILDLFKNNLNKSKCNLCNGSHNKLT